MIQSHSVLRTNVVTNSFLELKPHAREETGESSHWILCKLLVWATSHTGGRCTKASIAWGNLTRHLCYGALSRSDRLKRFSKCTKQNFPYVRSPSGDTVPRAVEQWKQFFLHRSFRSLRSQKIYIHMFTVLLFIYCDLSYLDIPDHNHQIWCVSVEEKYEGNESRNWVKKVSQRSDSRNGGKGMLDLISQGSGEIKWVLEVSQGSESILWNWFWRPKPHKTDGRCAIIICSFLFMYEETI